MKLRKELLDTLGHIDPEANRLKRMREVGLPDDTFVIGKVRFPRVTALFTAGRAHKVFGDVALISRDTELLDTFEGNDKHILHEIIRSGKIPDIMEKDYMFTVERRDGVKFSVTMLKDKEMEDYVMTEMLRVPTFGEVYDTDIIQISLLEIAPKQ